MIYLFILEASSAPPPNLNLSFYGVLFSEGNPGGSQVKFPWKGPFMMHQRAMFLSSRPFMVFISRTGILESGQRQRILS